MFIIAITKTHSDLPVCIVIDNYSIHTSNKTKENYRMGKEGLFLYYLPPYSLELNHIENKWNLLKPLYPKEILTIHIT